jgi:eukaryotic-like serine/threonine-protein kinase
MGAVYQVERISDGSRLALKMMKASVLEDPKAHRRFEREVQAGTEIKSDCVVRTLASGIDGESELPWLVMEYAEGMPLDTYVEEHHPVPREHVERITSQLFEAVGAGHAIGIVHRDLKPDNILVRTEDDGTPRIKVLDFGIAKNLNAATWRHTVKGLGTPIWTAPDQGKTGYVAMPRDDVWALGLLTYFLLTGRVYWQHANDARALVKLSMELVRSTIDPASVRAASVDRGDLIPHGFDDWFAKSVCREAEARFADANEAGAALQDVWAGRPMRASTTGSDGTATAESQVGARPTPMARRWLMVVGFAVLLIVVAVVSAILAR